MDNAPLRLELVPVDDQATADTSDFPAAGNPSATTEALQDRTAAAESALDAIDIPPVGRLGPPKLSDTQSIDPFVAQALREYAAGQIDKPLWEHALGQVNGDATAAETLYVRVRAASLRAIDRQRREARRAALETPADDPPNVEPPAWKRYKPAIAAAAIVAAVGMAAGLYVASGTGDSSEAPAAVAPPARTAAAAPAAPSVAAAKPAAASVAFDQKVQELRDAGNFNVMVLYATEWTRKEPDNAAAWDQLRAGYVHLRQYEDARSAAKKAVQLAPDDARMWRNLAAVNMDLDDPEGSLAAYEQAAARNATDVDSLHAIALLHTRLGHAQEAKGALDRAAAANPADPVTACLRSGIAQIPATRDAYTMSRQVRAIDNRCHGRSDTVAAAR